MGNNDWAAPAETITEDDFPGGRPDTSGMWPEGNYTGKYLRFECGASMLKATNYIRIFFDVQGRHVESTVWITDANFDYADKQLRVCGWNLQYPDVDFDPPELVPLYMKHGEYKGKPKEEWRISTLGPAKEADSNTMSRFAERSRARLAEKGEAHPPATMPAKASEQAATATATACLNVSGKSQRCDDDGEKNCDTLHAGNLQKRH